MTGEEECDCGPSWEECADPCCYPASLTSEDLASNSSALPCTRHTQPLCSHNPEEIVWIYGVLLPFLVIAILAILGMRQRSSQKIEMYLVSLILVLDWRWGRRLLYTHITARDNNIHIETSEQKERRLDIEAQKGKQ